MNKKQPNDPIKKKLIKKKHNLLKHQCYRVRFS